MRLALVSLIALAAGANAYAQTAAPTAPPTPAAAPPAAAATPAPAAAPTPDTSGAAPVAPAPPAGVTTDTTTPAAPPAPPPPPAPPTDPAAVALLDILQKVCIPSAQGGNFAQIVKTYPGLRKSGDTGWSLKQKDFTLMVENPGSNPTQCHVDVTHAADLEAPGRPIIVALNDWAGVVHGWSLYRNDKNVQDGVQYTTRSWQLDWNGTEQSLVFTTMRKPDGTPMKSNADQSQMVYGVEKTG